jgi:hypothetical protein
MAYYIISTIISNLVTIIAGLFLLSKTMKRNRDIFEKIIRYMLVISIACAMINSFLLLFSTGAKPNYGYVNSLSELIFAVIEFSGGLITPILILNIVFELFGNLKNYTENKYESPNKRMHRTS